MVDIIDTSQTITIFLKLHGFAIIINLTYPPEAYKGDLVPIIFDMVNTGGDNTLFVKYTQISPATPEVELWRGFVPSGISQPIAFQIIMPGENLTLRIDVGHEE